jgi:type VI secretion system protein VasG
MALCDGGKQLPPAAELQSAIRPALLQVFPAALVGRMSVVPYYPLSDSMLGRIVRLQLDRIVARVRQQYDVPFTYDDQVVELITSRCTEVESGGRMIDAVLTSSLLPQVSRQLLERTLEGTPMTSIRVTAKDGQFVIGM